MVADAVLRRGWPEELLAGRAAARPNVRASRRLRDVLKLASPLSESAGESITHLAMHDLGLPAPVQQQAFRDQAGLIGRVDFWFPDHGVVVEFDGLVKYRDASHRSGRSAEEVVIDEKLREDRLRAVPDVRHVVRPVWRDVTPGGAKVGMGVHPFGDPDIVDDFAAEPVPIDARDFHLYAAEWTPDGVSFSVDGEQVRVVDQSPGYPMQLMLGIYEFPDDSGGADPASAYPKELVVDYVRGYRPGDL